MATVVMTQQGTGNASMVVRMTYTTSTDYISITKLEGMRDKYGPTGSYPCTLHFKIAGATTNYNISSDSYQFEKLYYKNWSGFSGKTLSTTAASVAIELTFTSSISNIANSLFTTSIAIPAPAYPTVSDNWGSNITTTSATAYINISSNPDNYWRYRVVGPSSAYPLLGYTAYGTGGYTSPAMTGLTANTTYSFAYRYENAAETRIGSWSYRSFQTHPNTVQESNCAAAPTTTGVTLSMSLSDTSPTTVLTSYLRVYAGSTTSSTLVLNGDASGPLLTKTWSTGLSPNTKYYGFFEARTVRSLAYSGATWLAFWTHPNTVAVDSRYITPLSSTSAEISLTADDYVNAYRSQLDLFLPGTSTRVGHSKFRYLRIYSNGSTSNTGDHLCHVLAIEHGTGTNRALGKTVRGYTGDGVTSLTVHNPTNAVKASLDITYAEISWGSRCFFEVDLGAEYDINYVSVWRYYPDERTYYETAIEGLDATKTIIVQRFHEYAIHGLYKELNTRAAMPTYRKIVSGLTPNTTYTGKFNFRTMRSNLWSTELTSSFTTTIDTFVKVITTSGSALSKMWYIGAPRLLTTIGNFTNSFTSHYYSDKSMSYALKASTTYKLTFDYGPITSTEATVISSVGYGNTLFEADLGDITLNKAGGSAENTFTTPATFSYSSNLWVRFLRTYIISTTSGTISNIKLYQVSKQEITSSMFNVI